MINGYIDINTRTGTLDANVNSCAKETIVFNVSFDAGLTVAILDVEGKTLALSKIEESTPYSVTINTATIQAYELTRELGAGQSLPIVIAIGVSNHLQALVTGRMQFNSLYDKAPPIELAPQYPTSAELQNYLNAMLEARAGIDTVVDETKTALCEEIDKFSSETCKTITDWCTDVVSAKNELNSTAESAKRDINSTAESAKHGINSTVASAECSINSTVDCATQSLNETVANANIILDSTIETSTQSLNTIVANAKTTLNSTVETSTQSLNEIVTNANTTLNSTVETSTQSLNEIVTNASTTLDSTIDTAKSEINGAINTAKQEFDSAVEGVTHIADGKADKSYVDCRLNVVCTCLSCCISGLRYSTNESLDCLNTKISNTDTAVNCVRNQFDNHTLVEASTYDLGHVRALDYFYDYGFAFLHQLCDYYSCYSGYLGIPYANYDRFGVVQVLDCVDCECVDLEQCWLVPSIRYANTLYKNHVCYNPYFSSIRIPDCITGAYSNSIIIAPQCYYCTTEIYTSSSVIIASRSDFDYVSNFSDSVVAIGHNTKAKYGSVSIGYEVHSESCGVTIGKESCGLDCAVVVGVRSYAQTCSVVIGTQSQTKFMSTVVGTNVRTGCYSTVIGTDVTTDASNVIIGDNVNTRNRTTFGLVKLGSSINDTTTNHPVPFISGFYCQDNDSTYIAFGITSSDNCAIKTVVMPMEQFVVSLACLCDSYSIVEETEFDCLW